MVAGVERAEQVHAHQPVPLLFGQVMEEAVLEGARVVHEDVQPSEGVGGGSDQVARGFVVGDVVVAGDGLAAAFADVGDDLVGGRVRAAGAVAFDADVVHDDHGAFLSQRDGVVAAYASP